MKTSRLKSLFALAGALSLASLAWGYVQSTNDNGQRVAWVFRHVSIQVMVDNTVTLSDGNTRASSIQAAIQMWNAQTLRLQLAPQISAPGSGSDNNRVNEIFFSGSPYTYSWDANTLALTVVWHFDTEIVEADIIFNTAFPWDSYRGPLRGSGSGEIQRVALHEVGHVLGLDHPDEYGQSVAAIMNSTMSDIDALQPDDIEGAQSIYGAALAGPGFTDQPVDQTIYAGESAQFNVAAGGNPGPIYRWQRLPAGLSAWADLSNGGNYTGADSARLSVAAAALAMSGDQFRCVATNNLGSATSNPATLTVLVSVAPAFTLQPSNASVVEGTSVQFTIGVSGTPAPALQWLYLAQSSNSWVSVTASPNNTGTNSSTLTLAYTDFYLAGARFRCVATNVLGMATSDEAVLTVTPRPPQISSQPQDRTVQIGESTVIRVTANSSVIVTYQWQVLLPGATDWTDLADGNGYGGTRDNFLAITSPGAALSGNSYRCRLTNAGGTTISNAALLTLTVPPAPTIVTQLQDKIGFIGDSVTFTVNVSGGGHLSFVWQESLANSGTWTTLSDSATYSGTASGTLGIAHLNASFNGASYRYIASNEGGTVTSAAAVLTITPPPPPTIVSQPLNVTSYLGGSVTFWVNVTGVGPVTFLWQESLASTGTWTTLVNSNTYSGTESSFLSISYLDASFNGASYRCVVSNLSGSTTSTAGLLTLTVQGAAPGIAVQPQSHGAYLNGSTNFSVNVSGPGPFSYVWQQSLAGSNTWRSLIGVVGYSNTGMATMGINHIDATLDGSLYRCVVANPGGMVTSSAAMLTLLVVPAPVVANGGQPKNVMTNAGNSAIFTYSVASIAAITYKWQVSLPNTGVWTDVQLADGYIETMTLTGGAYVPTLTVTNAGAPLDGSAFRCVATNPGGSTTSASAILTVTQLPAEGVVASGAGSASGLFWRTDGSLWGMGRNVSGELGLGIQATSFGLPVQIATGVIAATGGSAYTLFLKSDQTLWGMGTQTYGELGNGQLATTQVPAFQIATGVIAVAAAANSSFYIKQDGGLWAMGNNVDQHLGDGYSFTRAIAVKVASDVIAVAAGTHHMLYLKADGTVWGVSSSNLYGQVAQAANPVPMPTQIATGAVGIAAGDYHSALLKSDGSLWTFGQNGSGQLGDGSLTQRTGPVQIATGVRAVAAGGNRTFFVKTDGTLWGTGDGYLGTGDAFGSSSPVMIASDVASVSVGATQAYYVKTDGSLWSFGSNAFGQLGDGTTADRATAVQVAGGTLGLPWPASNVVGTAGASGAAVRVSWNPSFGTSSFEVWRSNVPDFSTAIRVAANLSTPFFYDFNPVPRNVSYWIVAINAAGQYVSDRGSLNVVGPYTGVHGDFNGDGRSDILLTDQQTGERALWRMNGTTIVDGDSLGVFSNNWEFSATGDFNGDGNTDIFLTNTATGERVVWLMNGPTVIAGASLGILPTTYAISGVGDFNADGKDDIVLTNTATGDRAVWLMNGTRISAGAFIGVLPTNWQISGIGDFNADGKADIVLTNTTTGDRAAWLMNGTSVAAGAYIGSLPTVWSFSGIGDFNGDGKSDVVLSNTTTGDRAVWLMNGTSVSSGAFIGVMPTDWVFSQIGDFDGDGRADIFLTNTTTGDRAIWLMNGTTITSGAGLGVLSTNWLIRN